MQKSYFKGNFLGCNLETDLKMPKWSKIFEAFEIPCHEVDSNFMKDSNSFKKLLNSVGPIGFIVRIDPEQTYWPKVTSRIASDGSIRSNPIHLMTPDLSDDLKKKVLKYIN
jgi:acetolactate synthase-1/2/3 large subunit